MQQQPLYNRIAELRAARGLSQQQLADAIVVSRKTISTVETSRFTPSVVIALQLAQYFEVPVEQIFSFTDFRSSRNLADSAD